VGVFDSVTAALEAAQDHDIIEQSGEADQAWFSLNKVGCFRTWLLKEWSKYCFSLCCKQTALLSHVCICHCSTAPKVADAFVKSQDEAA
jgi:hypothetical protein